MHRPLHIVLIVIAMILALASCTTPERSRGGGGDDGLLCTNGQVETCRDDFGAVCEDADPDCTCACEGPGTSCISSADCPGELRCLSQTGQCVVTCMTDADCPGTTCIQSIYCGLGGDDNNGAQCRNEGGQYVCTDDETGQICPDLQDPECTCECVFNNIEPPECTSDADCSGNEICVGGSCRWNEPGPQYRFVMIEDLQSPVSGDYPGSDIDSVELIKAGGGVVSAQTIEDFENLTLAGNLGADPHQVLGSPDANCEANSGNFYAMGGAGSWMILGYGDAVIENGDSIDVVELGATECGTFDDDDFAIGVSMTSDDNTFVEIGMCTGSCTAFVAGL